MVSRCSGCQGRVPKKLGTHWAPTRQVNLKEQGQLVRQDEFTVRTGRHKSLRRVFLFEELLLFSKPRRGPTGIDTFTYKRSFKVGPSYPALCPHFPVPHHVPLLATQMADLGLTECCGDSNLRFEIWFRRRKARDTFVLQAASVATKQAWTADISRLLWKQAVHNKGRSLPLLHPVLPSLVSLLSHRCSEKA